MRVAADVRAEKLTAEAASRIYRVAVTDEGDVDHDETRRLRTFPG
jgi:hypothetical protein